MFLCFAPAGNWLNPDAAAQETEDDGLDFDPDDEEFEDFDGLDELESDDDASIEDDDLDDSERGVDEDDPDDLDAMEDDLDEVGFDEEGHLSSRAEILVLDMDADQLRVVEDIGFRLLERQSLSALGGTIDRLAAPADFVAPGSAIDALRETLPAAPFDYNHIYDLPEVPGGFVGSVSTPPAIGVPGVGVGVRIGVIDTLVDPSHASIADQSITVRDFAGTGSRDTAHATAVVSIITGSDPDSDYVGLLPGSDVYAANVFALNSAGRPTTTAFVLIEALDWLAAQDVGVINVSIAGPPSDVLQAALVRIEQRGHHVVAAVGNDGPAAPPLYPAAYANVTGVTATDIEGRIYRRAGRGAHVDVAAPGVGVRAALAGGTYDYFSGTSFATPVVSALIARELRTRHDAGPDSLAALRVTRDLGLPGRDDVFGLGLIRLMGD